MTGISTLLLYKLNLSSGKIQNLIELSAFLYQGSGMNQSDREHKRRWCEQKRIKKIVSTPSLTLIRKLLFCMGYTSYTKVSTEHDKNIHVLSTNKEGKLKGVCHVLSFLSLVIFWITGLLCAPCQQDEYCSFPLNNWIVRTRGVSLEPDSQLL